MQNTTLIAPDGREYVTSDPIELNNLVYGQGYRIKSGRSYDTIVNAGAKDGDAKAADAKDAEPVDTNTATNGGGKAASK
ncbi:MAG: hypothetical protein J0I34_07265 [Pseudonocardia sp.]|uniref:hypothetical protein n=1 Tax=Actinomycetes TaxID=1760 RepID=UPI00086AEF2B|nr:MULTISPECIES: hypothetical protein [Actinomycetes]MBN9108566.1 hypothetical protein [Pseudonocardia sp.]ODU27446.1 MAG: hypothetical protein ABS80_03455 [Pseudonocardia sp. SCN 72-51]ODV07792.1 MAG: hypothetical protein ABT15_06865 [Pseudonocardia sp. SCN 73-27]